VRLTVKQAAAYIPLAKGTLDHMRTAGRGPRFIKLGRKVLYDTNDLDAWIEQHKQQSTADSPRLLGRRRRRRLGQDLINAVRERG
jgi:excisionase family DNA binding protein